MKHYVISLSTAEHRRTHIAQEFGKQRIDYQFFDAVTFDDIEQVCQTLNLSNIHHTPNLANSEKGCFLSHASLWQKMLDEDLEWIAIFEDDVHLGQNAHLFLNDDAWLDTAFPLLKIEHFYEELSLGESVKSIDNRHIQPLFSANLGTAGYMIHQSIAKKLLDILKNKTPEQLVAIDHFMFKEVIEKQSLPVFQLNPALCIQSDRLNPDTALQSDISDERRQRMDNEKQHRTLWQKICREFGRVFEQAKKQSTPQQKTQFR